MLTHKLIREKGKIRLSECCKTLKEGDKVAVVRELSMQGRFPKRIQGKMGIIKNKIGESYMIHLNDGNKVKGFIIHPVHLKRMEEKK